MLLSIKRSAVLRFERHQTHAPGDLAALSLELAHGLDELFLARGDGRLFEAIHQIEHADQRVGPVGLDAAEFFHLQLEGAQFLGVRIGHEVIVIFHRGGHAGGNLLGELGGLFGGFLNRRPIRRRLGDQFGGLLHFVHLLGHRGQLGDLHGLSLGAVLKIKRRHRKARAEPGAHENAYDLPGLGFALN